MRMLSAQAAIGEIVELLGLESPKILRLVGKLSTFTFQPLELDEIRAVFICRPRISDESSPQNLYLLVHNESYDVSPH